MDALFGLWEGWLKLFWNPANNGHKLPTLISFDTQFGFFPAEGLTLPLFEPFIVHVLNGSQKKQ